MLENISETICKANYIQIPARGVEILFLSQSYSKCSGWMPLVGQLMLTVFQHIFANQVAYFEASACWYV